MDTPGEDMPSDTNRTNRNNLKMLLNSQTLFSLYNLDQESHHNMSLSQILLDIIIMNIIMMMIITKINKTHQFLTKAR